MENLWPLIIQLVTGALGGTAAGALMKKLSLGTALNAILGIIGGGLGGQLLNLLGVGTAGGGMDLNGIITSVLGGGVGGGILLAIVGLIKKAFSK
ncbi:MAG: GlsB/YeaQ/YmgE family stress response membrane protein [Bacteroidales bacterium]|nr:GlsB/YeaQ/YmgE family stress response membrane protein [Bacteroidales bacterium]